MTSAERQAFEAGHPGWHAWESDERHLYAVTTPANPYGRSFTVDAVTTEGLGTETDKAEAAWAKWAKGVAA